MGRALSARLLADGWHVRAAMRQPGDKHRLFPGVEPVLVGSIGTPISWEPALSGVQTVVHLAARAHVMSDKASDPLAVYREINVQGTRQLARAAAAAGTVQFIYLSSVKVNGEGTTRPYTEKDLPEPEDPYGISKWESEQVLRQIAADSCLVPVVLRPPLIYGPGVRANFLKLMEAAARGLPLPLASVHNRRSLIFLGNLVDAIAACLGRYPSAPRTFLVSDGEDISTADLVRRMAQSSGRRARLFACPPAVLGAAARLVGRAAEAKRLLGSLTVDSSAIRAELRWRPPYTMARGLEETSSWYWSGRAKRAVARA